MRLIGSNNESYKAYESIEEAIIAYEKEYGEDAYKKGDNGYSCSLAVGIDDNTDYWFVVGPTGRFVSCDKEDLKTWDEWFDNDWIEREVRYKWFVDKFDYKTLSFDNEKDGPHEYRYEAEDAMYTLVSYNYHNIYPYEDSEETFERDTNYINSNILITAKCCKCKYIEYFDDWEIEDEIDYNEEKNNEKAIHPLNGLSDTCLYLGQGYFLFNNGNYNIDDLEEFDEDENKNLNINKDSLSIDFDKPALKSGHNCFYSCYKAKDTNNNLYEVSFKHNLYDKMYYVSNDVSSEDIIVRSK